MSDVHPVVAVIECFESIPCDPCRSSCPRGAITFQAGIDSLPEMHPEKCTGCGVCVARCPGQAIFLVGKGEEWGQVSVPYEFLPVPEAGDSVDLLDRNGQLVCPGEVLHVMAPPSFDATAVVTLRVPNEHCDTVRGFRIRKGAQQ